MPGENDCRAALSPILVTETHLLVPIDLWEDALADSELEPLAEYQSPAWVSLPKTSWKLVRAVRKRAYRACNWYEELIRRGVPTSPGVLLKPEDWSDARRLLREMLPSHPFVRTCRASAKDVRSHCMFSDEKSAIEALRRSKRTKLFEGKPCQPCSDVGCHLFLRRARDYEWECRCFWTRDKLRAVSLPDDFVSSEARNSIVEFFRRFGPDLPYHSAVVDLGLVRDGEIEIVEINQFGPDMNAGSGRFSWTEDAAVLCSSPDPVFRPDLS
jgi:hypothetical protein